MSFVTAIKTCFSKYVTFSGRAARSEYWWFFLFIIIMSTVFGIADGAIFGPPVEGDMTNGPLASLFSLVILLPIMAVGWRRMHDAGKPGWYLLLPMAFSIAFFLVLMLGVVSFAGMENAGANPDTLRSSAVILGSTSLIVAVVVQLVLSVFLLWWLTRPSDPAENAYGPPPAS